IGPARPHGPTGVFCFDFVTPEAGERMKAALGSGWTGPPWPTEEGGSLVEELTSPAFARAVERARIQHVLRTLCYAGSCPARLDREVAHYLALLQASLRDPSKGRSPDLLYLQLVDRSRKTIRTIQGFGMPVSFAVEAIHTLDGDPPDIQA